MYQVDLSEALGSLLLAQGPVLLQLLQLWGVLAALHSSGGPTEKVEWDQEPPPTSGRLHVRGCGWQRPHQIEVLRDFQ